MSLKISLPWWIEKRFKDESVFRNFQRQLFDMLPVTQKEHYVERYKIMFSETLEKSEFHTGVGQYCSAVERYLETATSTGAPHVLPAEIKLLKQRLSRLVQVLTRDSNLSHTLTLPILYETYISNNDLHEAFHEGRDVDSSSPIHSTIHPLLQDWEILTFLPWIQELAQASEINPTAKASRGIVMPSQSSLGISPRPTTDLAKVQNLPWWPQKK